MLFRRALLIAGWQNKLWKYGLPADQRLKMEQADMIKFYWNTAPNPAKVAIFL